MPGIVGTLSTTGTTKELLNARTAMRYSSRYQDDILYEDDLIRCTRTHLNFIGENQAPIRKEHALAWVEGEFYNIEQLQARYHLESKSEGEILLECYLKGKIHEVLNTIDGYFCALIYDTQKRIISFVTDRYGLKPMYIWEQAGKLIFGSELKCFLAFQAFIPSINKSSIDSFLAFGHLSGENTWFEGVVLLGASMFWTYSIDYKKFTQRVRYWNWSNIEKQEVSYEDASVHLVELLRSAVKKRVSSSKNQYSVSLSGGLDSRMILAGVPNVQNLEAFTFGSKNCDDVKIARKVAQQKEVTHHFFELNKANWFNGRVEGLWRSDGAINLLHLHATQFHERISEIAPISLNGFAGDVIMGGSFLKNCDQRIEPASIPKIMSIDRTLDIEDVFFDIQSEDPFYIDFRIRRFTASGLNEIKSFENRIPFFDNQLIEFVYSLPDAYRWQNRLYTKVLLNGFPRLFSRIPKTGVLYPISETKGSGQRILDLLNRWLKHVGVKQSRFAPYHKWIDEYLELFAKVLSSQESLVPSFSSSLKPIGQASKTDEIEVLTRLFSLEVWFQQVFNGRYLTSEELYL